MTDTLTDALPATPVEEHRFPCSACGSDLRYDPGEGRLICDHCGATEPLERRAGASALKELDYRTAIAGQIPADEVETTRVITCESCGARTEYDNTIHAAECPFCATPIVTDTGTHRHIKPRGVLPFVLDERAAREAMTKWLGRLWFAPNGLQDYARKGRAMAGIYTPYWTFDADTRSRYTGQRGTHYYVTKTVTRNGKRVQVRERRTRWRPVSGQVARFFDDLLVLGSRSLPKGYTDALEPWDLSTLEPYQPNFLAGFRAEGYQVELEDAYTEAREKMDQIIRTDVRRDIGGDEQRVGSVDTDIGTLTFKHVLLPVWLAAYKFKGKSYRFVVNGQTGKVQGERPWSAVKIAIAVIIGLIIAAGIAYLVMQGEGAV